MSKILKQLGRKIRRLREKQDLTTSDLARLSSLKENYIISLEKGEIDCRLDKLASIANALNVETWELVDF